MSSLTKHLTNNIAKTKEYIICECCDYKCSKQCDFNKHIQTRKHKKAILLTNQAISLTEKEEKTFKLLSKQIEIIKNKLLYTN